MQFTHHRDPLPHQQEEILIQWIRNQPAYQTHTKQNKDELPQENLETILAIRKRISAQTNH